MFVKIDDLGRAELLNDEDVLNRLPVLARAKTKSASCGYGARTLRDVYPDNKGNDGQGFISSTKDLTVTPTTRDWVRIVAHSWNWRSRSKDPFYRSEFAKSVSELKDTIDSYRRGERQLQDTYWSHRMAASMSTALRSVFSKLDPSAKIIEVPATDTVVRESSSYGPEITPSSET